MKWDKEQITVAAVAAGVVGILLVLLQKQLPLGNHQKQPDKAASPPKVIYDQTMYMHELEKYKVDPGITPEPAFLPVRYPARAGHELSCLIEAGYEPLFRPRRDLYSWLDTPPSENA